MDIDCNDVATDEKIKEVGEKIAIVEEMIKTKIKTNIVHIYSKKSVVNV